MNKLANALVAAAFAVACGGLWILVTLFHNTAVGMLEATPIPAFVRFCFAFKPLLLVFPLLAVIYCLVKLCKSDGQKSWVAFFATTMYALVLLGLPVIITGWLLFIQLIELTAKR